MIHTSDGFPTCYAAIWCDYGDCEECEFARNTNSVEDALAGARADAEQNGWTLDGDRHYCPEHKPVVIDANQMELLP